MPGSKVVIGDGPDRDRLMRAHPDCHFPGYRFGAELAAQLAGADVFVFPSKTDTFGLVMLEAMACGLPVAALPVTGPIDVVQHGLTGVLNHGPCRRPASKRCCSIVRHAADMRTAASWQSATQQFLSQLARIDCGQDGEPVASDRKVMLER